MTPAARSTTKSTNFVVDRAVHEQAFGSHAALARHEVRTEHSGLGGRGQVGVVKDNLRAIAGRFDDRALHSCRGHDRLGGRLRAHESDAVYAGMRNQRLSNFAAAHHHRHSPRRKARLNDCLSQGEGRQRCLLRWLDDRRIARSKRGREQFRRDVHWEVPRRNQRIDAVWFPVSEHSLARVDARQHMGLEPLDLLGGQPEDLGRLGELVHSLCCERLAALASQLFGVSAR